MGSFVQFRRDGQSVWPYCSECGCRLEIRRGGWGIPYSLTHFGLSTTKDARGCICPSLFKIQYVQEDRVAEFI